MKFSNNQIRKYAHWCTSGLFLLLLTTIFLFLFLSKHISYDFFINAFLIIITIAFSILGVVKNIIHTHIPIENVCKTREEINKFMVNFISRATGTVTIVSHSLRWLCSDDANCVLKKIESMAQDGTKFEIITTADLDKTLTDIFEKHSAIKLFKRTIQPRSRFTIINSTKSDAAELAIAHGSIPNHKISIFNTSESKHILNLALDTIEQIKDYHGK